MPHTEIEDGMGLRGYADDRDEYNDGWNAALRAAAKQVECGCANGCAYPDNCAKNDVLAIMSLKK